MNEESWLSRIRSFFSHVLRFLFSNLCGTNVSKRPYGELGSVDRGTCCGCVSVESAFGPLSPGCGCEEDKVDEIVHDLKERMRRRGDTAQIQRAEQTLERLDEVDAKLVCAAVFPWSTVAELSDRVHVGQPPISDLMLSHVLLSNTGRHSRSLEYPEADEDDRPCNLNLSAWKDSLVLFQMRTSCRSPGLPSRREQRRYSLVSTQPTHNLLSRPL